MNQNISRRATTLRAGLCALVLGTGLAAQAAAPVITNLTLAGATAQFGVYSDLGITNQIQCCTNLGQPGWEVLTNLVVTESPYWYVHAGALAVSPRFYRVEALAGGTPSVQPISNMVWIPSGSFTMGSPESEPASYSWERPQTQVTLSQGFWLGKYEVTQGEYLSVMGSNPSYFTGDLSRPVECVSWNDAVAYCAALTQRERAAGRLPAGYEYRLPTEAQWEYACRAGTTTPFHYGEELRSGMANFYGYYEYLVSDPYHYNPSGIYLGRTESVGSYAPNAWGLHDMHGNVWEWCLDWFGAYPGGSVSDPTGPTTGSVRVLRGGGWDSGAYDCRSAFRSGGIPGDWGLVAGFRAALVSVP